MECAAHGLQAPALAEACLVSWKAAFDLVLPSNRPHRRIILALDDLQRTVEASPELRSVLQALWDQVWSRAAPAWSS